MIQNQPVGMAYVILEKCANWEQEMLTVLVELVIVVLLLQALRCQLVSLQGHRPVYSNQLMPRLMSANPAVSDATSRATTMLYITYLFVIPEINH
jgi:hypothetical protein